PATAPAPSRVPAWSGTAPCGAGTAAGATQYPLPPRHALSHYYTHLSRRGVPPGLPDASPFSCPVARAQPPHLSQASHPQAAANPGAGPVEGRGSRDTSASTKGGALPRSGAL